MSVRAKARVLPSIQPPRGELIFVSAVVVVAALLRFYRIDEKSIWLDEAFSVWIARHSVWEGWRWLVRIDQHPPLYYSLLHSWIWLFGEQEGAARTLSALASTLTAPLFYMAARRLLDRPTAAIAVGILAVSPFHVQFAQETRMYALLTFEAACVLFFLARLLTNRNPSSRDWLGLAVAQALAMLTHNTAAVFLPAALNAALGILFLFPRSRPGQKDEASIECASLTKEKLDAFRVNWVRYQGLALLLWLPWAMPFIIQAIGVEKDFWLPPPWPDLVLDTFRNFHFAFLPTDLPARPLWMWAYAPLAFIGFALPLLQRVSMTGGWGRPPVSRGRQADPQEGGGAFMPWPGAGGTALLFLCLFALPHLIALLVSMHRPIYAERPLIWTTLPYFLLVAAGIRILGGSALSRLPWARRGASEGSAATRGGNFAAILSLARQGAQLFILLAILTLSGLCLSGYYFWFQKEGWDQAASYIAARVEPGDAVVFNTTWAQIPFEYYYRRYGLDTELMGLPVDLFEGGELEPKMAESDAPRIHQLFDERARVWLVYSHNWHSDPDGIIPRELGKLFREAGRAEFVGIQIIRYDRSQSGQAPGIVNARLGLQLTD